VRKRAPNPSIEEDVRKRASPTCGRPSCQTLGPRVSRMQMQMQCALQSHPRLIEPLPLWRARQVRSAEHDTRNRRSELSVRKTAASERPHKSEAILGQVASSSPSLVWLGREDVGNVAFSLRQSVNAKPAHSQPVQSRSHKHQSPVRRVGLARGRGKSPQVSVCALGYEGEIQLAVQARSVRSSRWPNPSIEGTSNIWLRQLSAAPHVKR